MLERWCVKNFKSILNADLELAPLTIFAGANSSGKSSLIQSILLVTQTLKDKDNESEPLILNGPFVNLGKFDDIKTYGSTDVTLGISFSCNGVAVDTEYFSNPHYSKTGIKVLSTKISHNEHFIDCVFDFNPTEEKKKLCEGIFTGDRGDIYPSSMSYCIWFDDDLDDKIDNEIDNSNLDIDSEPTGCYFKHFLPYRICYLYHDYVVAKAKEYAEILTMSSEKRQSLSGRDDMFEWFSSDIINIVSDILKDIIDLKTMISNHCQEKEGSEYDGCVDYTIWFDVLETLDSSTQKAIIERLNQVNIYEKISLHLAPLRKRYQDRCSVILEDSEDDDDVSEDEYYLREAFYDASRNEEDDIIDVTLMKDTQDRVENFFSSNVKYLGPLRASPQAVYRAEDSSTIGISGENMASVFHNYKDKNIDYISPDNIESGATVTATLGKAVVDWLIYLDIAEEIKSEDMGKLGYSLKIRPIGEDSFFDLASVGVGISQVLPIIVMCLIAKSDTTFFSSTTFLFEQPELHLHPNMQIKLADFFLAMALSGKQIIIETHSEHIINQLCYRYAAAKNDDIMKDKTKIYFVEKHNKHSVFHGITINKYGSLSEWPKDFCDAAQNLNDKIIDAASEKAAREDDDD